jgi:hypothetical protein
MNTTMTIEQARKIIGNQADFELKHMVKALTVMNLLNTDEDNERLQAAKIVLKHRRKAKK